MGTKRYFWLKLMGDFFDRTEIRLIEKAPHGKELVLLYLKLLCKSLETDGALVFNGKPYTDEIISLATDTDLETVKSGISLFEQYGLIERRDNTFYMPQIIDLVASETYWAQAKRREREKKVSQELDNVQECPNVSNECQDNVSREDIEKDTEKIKTEKKKKTPCRFLKGYAQTIRFLICCLKNCMNGLNTKLSEKNHTRKPVSNHLFHKYASKRTSMETKKCVI